MLLRWFDSREAVALAKIVAEELSTKFPPESVLEPGKLARPKDLKKFERSLERIITFAKEKRLNFYLKSRLLNTLMWELKDRGYNETFVKRLIETITLRL